MARKTIIRLTESDIHNMVLEAVKEAVKQQFGSSATSINKTKTASGFPFFGGTAVDKKTGKPKWAGEPVWKKGMTNVDIGGGKYDNADEYLHTFGARNIVFDPFSRDAEHNGKMFDEIEANGGADTVTCFNCLNVIKEPEARDNVILQCSQVLKPGGKAYFQVYSGNKQLAAGGARQMGNDQWQEFRDITTYIPEIRKHFGTVIRKGSYIIASDPIDSEVNAEWHMDGTGDNFRTMKRFNKMI